MKIILGSDSPQKIEAVRLACARIPLIAKVTGIKTNSGQNEQPVGFHETYNGACTRASTAKANKTDVIAIGIESGIFCHYKSKSVTLDIAVIVILPMEGHQIVTTSMGLVLPEKYVETARRIGFQNTTVGSVIAEKLGGDTRDPHAALTDGKITRIETLTDALVIALRQL